jgi:glycosyltransferase involved in cell wall biosynthesis
MRVAVFNRYWATCGGGERYAGALAQVLATDHDVHLLSPTPVDRALLEERLGLDLSRATPRVVPDTPPRFTTISSEYDLLVNSSYLGNELNVARRGIYVVFFPDRHPGSFPLARGVGARPQGRVQHQDGIRVVWGDGFHLAERSARHAWRWTTSEARLYLTLPARGPARVRLTFLAYRPRFAPPAVVLVEVDGRVRARTKVGGDKRPVELDVDLVGRGADEPIPLVIRSDTFMPTGAAGDERRLGVPLASVRVAKGGRSWLLERLSFLAPSKPSLDFLATYQEIVSISEFTRRWVRNWWGRESRVIYPPVAFETAGAQKLPLILSVGRFFDRHIGHSKKQIELVRAFRALVARGLPRWELHLVGSCQQKHAGYVARVRAEAQGLPVHFHLDASGQELRELYRRASIYWHAAGLSESERRHPERLEHFGISTVEAMGAGAVPVVVGRGGQREIVQHHVNGYHVQSLNDLVAQTYLLANDPARRRRLAEAARKRAGKFSTERFTAGVHALLENAP